MSDEKQALTIRIPTLDYEALRAYAYYTGQSKTAVGALAIKEFLVTHFDEDFMARVEEVRERVTARLAEFGR